MYYAYCTHYFVFYFSLLLTGLYFLFQLAKLKSVFMGSINQFIFRKKKWIHTTTLINYQRICLVSYKEQFQGLVQHDSIYTESWNGKFIAMENWEFIRLRERRKWECIKGPHEGSLFRRKYSVSWLYQCPIVVVTLHKNVFTVAIMSNCKRHMRIFCIFFNNFM